MIIPPKAVLKDTYQVQEDTQCKLTQGSIPIFILNEP